MAYLFNSINSQIDEKPKTDIFGQNAPQAGSAQAGGQSDVFQTASTNVSPTGGGGSSAGAKAKQNVRGTGSGGAAPTAFARQSAYDKLGAPDASQQTQKIETNLSGAEAKLQADANAYRERAEAAGKGYGLDQDTLSKAALGDDAAFKKTAARLGKGAADPFEAFAGAKAEDVPTGADAFKSPSTFGEIFRPTAGANYSGGESALNSLLLKRSPGFRQTAANLSNRQAQFGKTNAELMDTATTEARTGIGKAFDASTQAARDQLSGMNKSIIDEAKRKEAIDEARRAQLDPGSILDQKFTDMRNRVAETNPDWAALTYDRGSFGNFDPYLSMNKDVDYGQFIDQPGADRFNRINSLLGNQGDVISAGKVAPDYTFDPGIQGYFDQILGGKVQERGRLADEAAQNARRIAQADKDLATRTDRIIKEKDEAARQEKEAKDRTAKAAKDEAAKVQKLIEAYKARR